MLRIMEALISTFKYSNNYDTYWVYIPIIMFLIAHLIIYYTKQCYNYTKSSIISYHITMEPTFSYRFTTDKYFIKCSLNYSSILTLIPVIPVSF